MFCFQCQETAKNIACTTRGVCGKTETTANLQDLLIYVCKGISIYASRLEKLDRKIGRFLCRALFTTLTNVGWDDEIIIERIKEGLRLRDSLKGKLKSPLTDLPDCATWSADKKEDIKEKASSFEVRINSIPDEDVRSLKSLITFGIKGISAYAEHAANLGYESDEIYNFIVEGLASLTKELKEEELFSLVVKTGEIAVKTIALLDEANTKTFGHPEFTEVKTKVGSNPGILITGHDLKDLYELLEQTQGENIDVYTHGEMLPAHFYPAFKKFKNLIGNYGGSWPAQNDEFESFNGPILATTNCLIPLRKENTYLSRLFTLGPVSYPGAIHIPDREDGKPKDFTKIIEVAKRCSPPKPLKDKKIYGGFGHNQILSFADRILDLLKSGDIKRFVVMAGCDGRHKTREYFTEVAKILPKDTVILTAGCAKFRYNTLPLGDIKGIPRVIDAGQCNDSYSLAYVALKLKELLGFSDLDSLPISFDIAWYEQKAVSVLLAVLYLGFKGIRLGPTLPAFISPRVGKMIVERFDLKPISSAEEDVKAMLSCV